VAVISALSGTQTPSLFSKAFETDLFPLAFDWHDVDVGVGCNIAAAASTDGMPPQLIGMVPSTKKRAFFCSLRSLVDYSLTT
jgi:hypothetical protein